MVSYLDGPGRRVRRPVRRRSAARTPARWRSWPWSPRRPAATRTRSAAPTCWGLLRRPRVHRRDQRPSRLHRAGRLLQRVQRHHPGARRPRPAASPVAADHLPISAPVVAAAPAAVRGRRVHQRADHPGPACTSDVDTTGFAVQALATVPGTDDVAGRRPGLPAEGAADGGLYPAPAAMSSNSTALAAQGLRRAGRRAHSPTADPPEPKTAAPIAAWQSALHRAGRAGRPGGGFGISPERQRPTCAPRTQAVPAAAQRSLLTLTGARSARCPARVDRPAAAPSGAEHADRGTRPPAPAVGPRLAGRPVRRHRPRRRARAAGSARAARPLAAPPTPASTRAAVQLAALLLLLGAGLASPGAGGRSADARHARHRARRPCARRCRARGRRRWSALPMRAASADADLGVHARRGDARRRRLRRTSAARSSAAATTTPPTGFDLLMRRGRFTHHRNPARRAGVHLSHRQRGLRRRHPVPHPGAGSVRPHPAGQRVLVVLARRRLTPAGHYSQLGAYSTSRRPGELELWIFGGTDTVAGTQGRPTCSPASLRAANPTPCTRRRAPAAPAAAVRARGRPAARGGGAAQRRHSPRRRDRADYRLDPAGASPVRRTRRSTPSRARGSRGRPRGPPAGTGLARRRRTSCAGRRRSSTPDPRRQRSADRVGGTRRSPVARLRWRRAARPARPAAGARPRRRRGRRDRRRRVARRQARTE